MKRYWASFYADDPRPVGNIENPGHFFWTGTRGDGKEVLCVAVQAESEQAMWDFIKGPDYYPEAEYRFCEERPDDWVPGGDRFPGAQVLVIP